MKTSRLYRILRPIITFLVKVFIRPKYIGLNNIPKNKCILAGTHTHNLDSVILLSSTKETIHFLAKKELCDGFFGFLFKRMGIIPVKRDGHDHNALVDAKKCLENDQIIGIFPEGTTQKGRGLLPFKIGAVKMAYDTKSPIIPFVIKGKYRLFSKDLKIVFGKPIMIKNDDLEKENVRFRNIILKMLEDE